MPDRKSCASCGCRLKPSDSTCPACGLAVDFVRSEGVPTRAKDESEPNASAPAQAMRLCGACGFENPVSNNFCGKCGASLGGRSRGDVSTQQGSPTGIVGRQTMDPISNRKKVMRVHAAQDKKKVGIFVLYAVVTLVLLSGVAYVITYLQDRPFTNPPASSQPPFSENKTGLLKDIDRLKKVVEANPENMDSTLRLANLLHDVSLADQAIPYYERYLDKNPQDADARVDMGICYFELSRKDTSKSKPELNTAVGEMEKALAYNPRHQLACYNLGIVNLSAGNFQKSSEWFKRCIEIDPAAEISNKAKQLLTDHNSVK